MSLELGNNKVEQIKEFEKLDLYDIRETLYKDDNDMRQISSSSSTAEGLNETEILNKYFEEDTLIKDFLLLKYGGSLYETSDFIEKFNRTDIKVFLYEDILSDRYPYLTRSRNMAEYTDFLDSVLCAMSKNIDHFQNITLCSYILKLREGKNEGNEVYLELEKGKLMECMQQNISIVEDIGKPIETYKSLKYNHLTSKVVKNLLCDLETREEKFSEDELDSIVHSAIVDKLREKETGNSDVKNEERRSLVDLVYEKLITIENSKNVEIYFKLILLAGQFGYDEFFESHIGGFYEEFEGVSNNFLIEKRIDLLNLLIERGKKFDALSFDVAKNLYESFRNQHKDFPKTTLTGFFMEDLWNYYDCNKTMESAAKNDFVRDELLRYTYNECASSFDRMAWRLIRDSKDVKKYVSELLSKKEFPKDVKLSVLMKMASEQLYKKETDEFKESVVLIREFSKTIKVEENTLVSIYGMDRFLRDLSGFSAEIVHSDKKILNKEQKVENQKLSRYVMSVFNEQFNPFFELLKDEKLLNQMDLYESSDFFMALDNTLLSVDNPDVNNHIKSYLEKTLDKYMNFYRKSPGKFFENVGESSIGTWDYTHQLFADLGVLSFYIEGRDLIYKINKSGKARYTKYGFPLINQKKIRGIRGIKGGETDRIGEKYGEFLWDMLVKNNKDERAMGFWIGGLAWNFKHPSSHCMMCYNRELSEVFHLTDSRYHLNGTVFPILRKKFKESKGAGLE